MTTQGQLVDSKSLAIGVLSITACVLFVGFLLVTTLSRPVYAVGENDSAGDYKIATQQLTTSAEGLVVIDAAARRLIVYSYDYNRRQLLPLSAFDLKQLQAPPADQGQRPAGRRGG